MEIMKKSPSFSSTLLDSIYRSIDEESGSYKEDMVSYKTLALATRQNRATRGSFREKAVEVEEEVKAITNLRRVEKWMSDKRRPTEPAPAVAVASRKSSSSAVLSTSNSSSSSSDSSFWSGGLSSSESESFRWLKSTSSSSSSSSSCYSIQRPKPVRTDMTNNSNPSSSQKLPKHRNHEEALSKTKSKALKIYQELKKAKGKQPVSPGNKISSFINSLFANPNKKKPKFDKPYHDECPSRVKYTKSNSVPSYNCPSSASSYSRSCLSKTPSSSGTKRSVRFNPVSVIVDEDSRACGLKIHVLEENRRVSEAARNLLENYRNTKDRDDDVISDDDDDDDGSSCSSSDLFELDNLSSIGIERYREELPVYETTHIGTNRAIASGLII